MNTRRNKWMGIASILALVMDGTSCTSQWNEVDVPQEQNKQWTITATQGGGVETRLTYGGDANVVKWSSTDKFKVFGDGAGEEFSLVSGGGETSAVFEGSTPTGTTFNAYYPSAKASATWNDGAFDASGQTQVGNANMAHLSAYDFMTGTVTVAEGKANVNFEHKMVLMKFVITLPMGPMLGFNAAITPLTNLTISTDRANAFYIKKGVVGTGLDEKANSQTLVLNNVMPVNRQFTAYMMMNEFELKSGDKLTITVNTNITSYTHTATLAADKSYEAGYRYTATVSPTFMVAGVEFNEPTIVTNTETNKSYYFVKTTNVIPGNHAIFGATDDLGSWKFLSVRAGQSPSNTIDIEDIVGLPAPLSSSETVI